MLGRLQEGYRKVTGRCAPARGKYLLWLSAAAAGGRAAAGRPPSLDTAEVYADVRSHSGEHRGDEECELVPVAAEVDGLAHRREVARSHTSRQRWTQEEIFGALHLPY